MKSGMIRLVSVLLLAFLVVYGGWQVYRFVFAGYKTETAAGFEVARSITTRGILVRTEERMDKNITGVVHYLAPEGSKFVSSTPLAEVYSSQEEADDAARRSRLAKERDLIRGIRESTNTDQTQDLGILSGDISAALTRLTRSACYQDPEPAEELRMTLTEKFTRSQMITGTVTADSLKAREDELEAQTPAILSSSQVYGSGVGYFSRFVDNNEKVFIPAMLDDLDSGTIGELLSREYPYDDGAFGKKVTDFRWYYATTVSIEEAAMFSPGVQVTMTFSGGSGASVTGTVDRVTEEPENQCAVVVIRSDEINSDTISRRTATVKVGFSNYQGVRFSKKALRIVNNQKGVYIKSGYEVQFRLVDIVYTGKDFYLSRMEYNSSTYLNMFDEVIVEGTDLYDGKPLQ